MNIIVVMSDSLRKDHLGAYGSEWCRTPRLDEFAADALVFDRAFQSSHPTIPNRTDLFTGRFGFPWYGWQPLDRELPVMSEILGESGLLTMLIADTYHLFKQGFYFDRGFSGWWWNRGQEGDRLTTDPTIPLVFPCDPSKIRQPYPDRYPNIIRNRDHRRIETDWFAPGTVSYAMQWLERNYQAEQFLLWVDCFDPHEPWDPPQYYVDMYDPDHDLDEDCDYPQNAPQTFLSERELHHTRARYAGEVTMVDKWFGLLMDKVKDLGLWEDTLIMFLSDHGEYFDYPGDGGLIGKPLSYGGDHYPFYQALCNVPYFIRPPKGGGGRRCQAIVQAPDVLPTFLDILGVEAEAAFHGRSFANVIRGVCDDHRDFAVSAAHRGVMQYTDEQYSYACWRGQRAPVLFDLQEDRDQERNVADDHPDVADECHDKLMDFLAEIEAPQEVMESYQAG